MSITVSYKKFKVLGRKPFREDNCFVYYVIRQKKLLLLFVASFLEFSDLESRSVVFNLLTAFQ